MRYGKATREDGNCNFCRKEYKGSLYGAFCSLVCVEAQQGHWGAMGRVDAKVTVVSWIWNLMRALSEERSLRLTSLVSVAFYFWLKHSGLLKEKHAWFEDQLHQMRREAPCVRCERPGYFKGALLCPQCTMEPEIKNMLRKDREAELSRRAGGLKVDEKELAMGTEDLEKMRKQMMGKKQLEDLARLEATIRAESKRPR